MSPVAGHLTFRRHYDHETGNQWVEVSQADPVVLIDPELIQELILQPKYAGWGVMTLDLSTIGLDPEPGVEFADWPCRTLHPGPCYAGAILRVNPDRGDSYRYVIGQYDPEHRCWQAAWPD